MKRRLFIFALVLCVQAGLLAVARAQDVAPTPTPAGSRVLSASIYVRSGPGENYLPVGHAVAGDLVLPQNRNADGTWVLISYNRAYGWVRRDLVHWVENIDALPILEVGALTPTPIPGIGDVTRVNPTYTPTGSYVDVVPGGVIVRAGPAFQYANLGTLRPGTVVEPLGRNADTSWILIRYNEGFAWVLAQLVRWQADLTTLPLVDVDNLTPTATYTGSPSATMTLTPSPTDTPSATRTPSSTATETATATNTATHTPTDTPSATRTPSSTATKTATATHTTTYTPTDTPTLTRTSTRTPTATPTASRTSTSTATNRPTATPTATRTAVPTDTPAATEALIVPSDTALPTETSTATRTPSPEPTDTVTPTLTETAAPTLTATPTQTDTPVPTVTATRRPTDTAVPTLTDTATEAPSATPTATITATETPEPSDTMTPEAVATTEATIAVTAEVTIEAAAVVTAEETSAATAEATAVASEQAQPTTDLIQSLALALSQEPIATTGTADVTAAVTSSATVHPTLTNTTTEAPSATLRPTRTARPPSTETPIPTATDTPTLTEAAATTLEATAVIAAPEATATNAPPTATETRAPEVASVPTGPAPLPGLPTASGSPRFPLEALVGGLGLFLVIGYAGLYWRGILQTERYAKGFVVKRCPVCREGRLEIETRYERSLGIPRARRTVRCTNCRSVLRETGNHQWRYAIDPFVSPALYARFNGRIVDDDTLKKLMKEAPPASQPPRPRDAPRPPTFVDDDRE